MKELIFLLLSALYKKHIYYPLLISRWIWKFYESRNIVMNKVDNYNWASSNYNRLILS
jgi:hypothetical protein